MKDLRTIKSAHRVLEILEYFDRDHRTATVMDLSRSLGYPQSSTSELLRCLTRLGYLHYNRHRRAYSPTARVALLGSWVEPALFRGGRVLTALDRMADCLGETVILSTAANYAVQHLHVVDGSNPNAIVAHAGQNVSLLRSPQGRLILSSYREIHIRSALHRLNADESNPDLRVRINETLDELLELRRIGWVIDSTGLLDGAGSVAVMLPPRKGLDRLVLSVVAPAQIIEAQSDRILALMLEQRNNIVPPSLEHDKAATRPLPGAVAVGLPATEQDTPVHQRVQDPIPVHA